LGVAAGDDDFRCRIPAMGAPDENAGGMIGLRGNAARIYDDHVSFLGPLCAMPRGAQQAADSLAVGPGGPASKIFDVKTGHFPSVKPSPALHEAVPMGAVGQFEGYGLQPVRYPRKISMALAPEGMLIQNDTLPNGEDRIRRGAGIFCLNTVRFCIPEDGSTPQASSYCSPLGIRGRASTHPNLQRCRKDRRTNDEYAWPRPAGRYFDVA
jgi:hypothetical protein